MDNEAKFWVWVVALVSSSILIFTGMTMYFDYRKDLDMAHAGLQKTSVLGQHDTYYQKIPACPENK